MDNQNPNNQISSPNLRNVIQELIKRKAIKRGEEKNNRGETEKRHKIFGTTTKPPNDKDLLPQGSKILPYIKKENGNYIGGFLSIIDLINLYGSD